MRILVTGSNGYIGSRLTPKLMADGHEVIGLDRASTEAGAVHRFIHTDLRDRASYENDLAGIDYVFHLAAAKGDWGISEDEYMGDNVDATRSLLDAGRRKGIARWMFYSTVSTLGPSATPLTEAAEFAPINPYGASKAEAEKLFQQYVEETEHSQAIILRPSVVFGPDNPENTNVFRLIEGIYRGRFVMIGDGSPVKTTSYIDNLIPATMFLFHQSFDERLRVFHYVDEPCLSTGELVRLISALLKKRPPRVRIPLSLVTPIAWLSDVAGSMSGIDFPVTKARITKFCTPTNFDAGAIRALGFTQPVSNEDALAATVTWFLNRVGDAVQSPG